MAELLARKYLEANKLVEKLNYIEAKTDTDKEPNIGVLDKDLGWALKPNSQAWRVTSEYEVLYSINSKGIRDKEILPVNSSDVFRILALGESTVFGQCINYGERFSEIIESSLKNVEVINMGIWSFGADQASLQLERDGFQFSPRLIILFAIKDLFDRCKQSVRMGSYKPRFVLDDAKNSLVLLDPGPIRKRIKLYRILSQKQVNDKQDKENIIKALITKSSLYTLLSYNKRIDEARKRLEKVDREVLENIDKEVQDNVRFKLRKDKEIKCNAMYSEQDFHRLIFLLLKKYKDVADAHSVNFMLAYIDTDKEYFTNYIQGPCNELGIDCFDASGILSQASRIKSLKFKIDPHYNAFAHLIIGKYTSDYLAKKYNLQKTKYYVHDPLDK